MFFQQGVKIKPKKNQRKVRDEEKWKENEKSNLKRQKSTWVSPVMGGIGGWWNLLVVPQTLEQVMGWKRGIGGGWVFWREIWEGEFNVKVTVEVREW